MKHDISIDFSELFSLFTCLKGQLFSLKYGGRLSLNWFVLSGLAVTYGDNITDSYWLSKIKSGINDPAGIAKS